MDVALYGPDGFYTTGGGAGRRRDFLTSPEVGPLFGAVIACALESWWNDLGRPDPFVVVEAGAGPGTLCQAIFMALADHPELASAFKYVLVDRSPAMREIQASRLPLASVDDMGQQGSGPFVCTLSGLPAPGFAEVGVVIANELLDNLVFDIVERTDVDTGWDEIGAQQLGTGMWVEARRAAPATVIAQLPESAGDVEVGQRLPVHSGAAAWLRSALSLFSRGRVMAIDYAVGTTFELARRPDAGWLRTYRGHERGSAPFDRLGTQDITTDVAIDQLARVKAPVLVRSQAEFLRAHGVEELVDAGRAYWEAHAARPDLAAVTARSRITEAHALLDPSGLGAFTVIEW
jgi:SAM-dependent MidA family methyltransferase